MVVATIYIYCCLRKMNENNLTLFLLLLISFFFLSIFFIFTLVFTYKKIKRLQELENYANVLKGSLAANSNSITNTNQNAPTDPTHFAQTLLLEILPSKSAKWERLLSGKDLQGPNLNGSGHWKVANKPGSVEEHEKADKTGSGQEGETGTLQYALADYVGLGKELVSGCRSGQVVMVEEEKSVKKKKKKKKKRKKKRVDLKGEEVVVGEENGGGSENLEPGLEIGGGREMGYLCPFTSMGSPTQRKIKGLYHQLVHSFESNELTLAQVGEFTKCLAQAKEELEDKAEAVKRKFSIKKALLSKADRSSIDRLRQQIYNLEKQQMRLEEDVCVYNWLQDQLQLSPACRKMLQVCADLELKTKSSKPLKSTEPDEFADISFEELLALEKKDSFWQKNWKSRMCTR